MKEINEMIWGGSVIYHKWQRRHVNAQLRFSSPKGHRGKSALQTAPCFSSDQKGLYLPTHRDHCLKPALSKRMCSYLVGLSHVELVQCAPQSSLTCVDHELTHLPASSWRVQVHVVHSTANLPNLMPWQLVDDEPSGEKYTELKNLNRRAWIYCNRICSKTSINNLQFSTFAKNPAVFPVID